MSGARDIQALINRLLDGRETADELDETTRATVVDRLIEQPEGRRWLRSSSLLNRDLADRLVAYPDDFRSPRLDMSLEAVIALAGLDALVEQAEAIAAGSGAPALWSRLSEHPERFQRAIRKIVDQDDPGAIDATATHLLLDPTNVYRLDPDQRVLFAIQFLDSNAETGRGIASEYLATAAPNVLEPRLDELVRDRSAKVRGFAWLAAFHVAPDAATNSAIEMLGDESVAVEVRRSALNAAGETLPTDQMLGLLSYFVVHPSEALALDAANLLHRHHRHPEIAIAAAASPHDEVREIANRLMDPYRGSPAAGGSRPGDPLRSDPLLELMRRLEEEETGE